VLLGKIIRIDPHPGQSPAYTIPAGNPFAGGGGRAEVWSYGLRNPWRFSFDFVTHDMVIGDVGQDAREEVDLAASAGGAIGGAGVDYGWNCREGFIAYSGAPGGCGPASSFTEPVFDYPHEDPGGGAPFGCSIIGGYVVRDQSVPELYGRYLYTDFCGGEIRSLLLPASAGGRASGERSEGLAIESPTSFGEDSCGRVYVASDEGRVYRLEGATPATCPQPQPIGVSLRKSSPRPHVRLRAKRHGAHFSLSVWVTPCAGHARAQLRLNRGGKPLRLLRLNSHCVARSRLRLSRKATFRAVLLGESTARSPRLSLRPAPRR
jgi:hypothetical protein